MLNRNRGWPYVQESFLWAFVNTSWRGNLNPASLNFIMVLAHLYHHFFRKRLRCLCIAAGLILTARILWIWNGSESAEVSLTRSDKDLCRYGLLDAEGRLLPGDVWTPSKCSMLHYSTSSLRQCLSQRLKKNMTNKFIFMGDSMMRHKARALVQMIGIEDPKNQSSGTDWVVKNSLATVRAVLNEMLFEREVDEEATVFVFGSDLWFNLPFDLFPDHRKHLSLGNISLAEMVGIYKNRLHSWARRVSQWTKTDRIIWYLQDPVYPGFKNVTNKGVSLYNRIARDVLKDYPKIWIWSSARKMTEALIAEGNEELREVGDFVHVKAPVIKQQMQVILNLLCNTINQQLTGRSYCCRNNAGA